MRKRFWLGEGRPAAPAHRRAGIEYFPKIWTIGGIPCREGWDTGKKRVSYLLPGSLNIVRYRKVTKMYEKFFDETIQCDLCEARESGGEVYRSDDLVCLCPACLDKIEAAPDVFRRSMESILIGNVV